MKNTFISSQGGGIEFISLISMMIEILSLGVAPRVVAGNSSGALLMFLYVNGKITNGLNLARQSHKISTIFSSKNSPFGKIKGLSLRAWYRGIFGKESISKMDNLEKNLRMIVSAKNYLEYRDSNDSIDCYILVTNECIGLPLAINLKEKYPENMIDGTGSLTKISYNEAIELVIGSASIQPISPARNFRGLKVIDGGHTESHPASNILDNNLGDIISNIDECISLFSRPEPKVYKNQEIKEAKNVIEKIGNSFKMQLKHNSLKGEYKEKDLCNDNNIQYTPIYLEDFTSGFFRASKKEIIQGEINGIEAVRKYYM